MRKTIFVSFMLFMLLPAAGRAQNYMVPTAVGTVLEYVSYDIDGTVTDRVTKTVEAVITTSRGTEVVLRTDMLNANGLPAGDIPPIREKIVVGSDRITKLKDGSADFVKQIVSKVVAGDKLNAEQREKLKNMDFVVEGDDIVYPAFPKSGEKLPESTVTVRAEYRNSRDKDKSMKLVTINGNGKIVATAESISTDAGTFPCIKISKTARFKMLIGLLSETHRVVSWYAPGIGEVMTQEVTKKGEVQRTTKLISIKRP